MNEALADLRNKIIAYDAAERQLAHIRKAVSDKEVRLDLSLSVGDYPTMNVYCSADTLHRILDDALLRRRQAKTELLAAAKTVGLALRDEHL